MSWGPIAAGDGRPSHHTFTTDSGPFVLIGLQNSAIAMHLEDINNNNALYVCTGGWTITQSGTYDPPVPGTADFTPSAADLLPTNPLGKPGLYKAYPVVTFATGPVAMDFQIIQVVALP